MWQVLTTFIYAQIADWEANISIETLAIRIVGVVTYRPIFYYQEDQVWNHHYKLLHQIGGS